MPMQEKHNIVRHMYILDFRGKKKLLFAKGVGWSNQGSSYSVVYTRLVYSLKQASGALNNFESPFYLYVGWQQDF